MMDWTTYFSAVIDLTTLLLGVLGILITFILRDTESQWRRVCIVFFSAMILKTAAAADNPQRMRISFHRNDWGGSCEQQRKM